jgi:predicted nucleic-acid-binding Zn-ribbon protein
MTSRPLEIETTESGVPSWRIRGTEPVVLVCGKCGYIEFYDREKIK